VPRTARVVLEGIAHHVTSRGNFRYNVFIDDTDRLKYLKLLDEYSKEYALSLYAFCLMDNHVHLIVVPERPDSLAKAMQYTQMSYSNYFNKKQRRNGHLWQSRFYSCPLDEQHAIEAVRYVERNPVRAKMVDKPWEYKWSSALTHVAGALSKSSTSLKYPPLKNLDDLGFNWNPEGWMDYLGYQDEPDFLTKLRKLTMTGRPLMGEKKKQKIEQITGLSLSCRPRGRPKRQKTV
jgi:putative transposase